MEEIWVDIMGYEGYYQVSNIGNVKTMKREVKMFNGGSYLSDERLMIPNITPKGYLRVGLLKDKIVKKYLVHRLVAHHFIENNQNYDQINHIDGNKKNNCLSNLEWCNNSQNVKHSYKIGLQKAKVGKDNHSSKKVAKYDMEGNLIKIYDYMTEAARDNNSCVANISACCNGKRNKVRGHIFKIV